MTMPIIKGVVIGGDFNTNHDQAMFAEKLRVINGIIRLGVPQPTEWQRIRNQIHAAIIFTRSDFVKMR